MTTGAVSVEYDVITQFRPGSLLNMENFNVEFFISNKIYFI
jgi:hypothetical protein